MECASMETTTQTTFTVRTVQRAVHGLQPAAWEEGGLTSSSLTKCTRGNMDGRKNGAERERENHTAHDNSGDSARRRLGHVHGIRHGLAHFPLEFSVKYP